MAKRLTDTTKWSRANFRTLSPKMKLVWFYLCDNCDHAGVWQIDFELMSFQIGSKVTNEEIGAAFGPQIVFISADKLYISSFVSFQYGNLTENSSVHRAVSKVLKTLNINTLTQGLPNPKVTTMDKDKALDKDKDKNNRTLFEFEKLYKKYPRKLGKEGGLAICKREIKTQADFDLLATAINKYRRFCELEKKEAKHILYFSTFMGSWRQYLDPDWGQSEDFSKKRPQGRITGEW